MPIPRPPGGAAPGGAQKCRPPANQPGAYPFPGRPIVAALQERDGQDSPAERDGEVMGWFARGMIDPVRWMLVPLPPPLRGTSSHVRVWMPADAISMGGVRICASMVTAQHLADAMGCLLPTAGIVAARHAAATLILPPWRLGHELPPKYPGGPKGWCNPGGGVVPWLQEQDGIAMLLEQADPTGARRAVELIDTTGKDYVLGSYVLEHPDRCSIFGWYDLNGLPIQSPKSGGGGGHSLEYFDYSHRIMPVWRTCIAVGGDGTESLIDLGQVYAQHPELVSYERTADNIPTRHPGILPRGDAVPPSVGAYRPQPPPGWRQF